MKPGSDLQVSKILQSERLLTNVAAAGLKIHPETKKRARGAQRGRRGSDS